MFFDWRHLKFWRVSFALNPGAAMASLIVFLLTSPGVEARDITIVALGDSIISGYGVPKSQGYVPQLERWLRARGHDVRIVNAGLAGDTAAGARNRAGKVLSKGVDGVIIGVGGNDMLRGTPVQSVHKDLGSILDLARSRGIEPMLIGYQSPGNHGRAYKKSFDGIYPDLARRHRAVLASSYISGLKERPSAVRIMICCMQKDRMHPNARGVDLMVRATGPKVERLIRRIRGGK